MPTEELIQFANHLVAVNEATIEAGPPVRSPAAA
jgi:hypothetical protein